MAQNMQRTSEIRKNEVELLKRVEQLEQTLKDLNQQNQDYTEQLVRIQTQLDQETDRAQELEVDLITARGQLEVRDRQYEQAIAGTDSLAESPNVSDFVLSCLEG